MKSIDQHRNDLTFVGNLLRDRSGTPTKTIRLVEEALRDLEQLSEENASLKQDNEQLLTKITLLESQLSTTKDSDDVEEVEDPDFSDEDETDEEYFTEPRI